MRKIERGEGNGYFFLLVKILYDHSNTSHTFSFPNSGTFEFSNFYALKNGCEFGNFFPPLTQITDQNYLGHDKETHRKKLDTTKLTNRGHQHRHQH